MQGYVSANHLISHRNLPFDCRVGIISFKREIVVAEAEYILYIRVYRHTWQFTRGAAQLFPDLAKVVGVDMRVSESVYEFSGFKSANLSHHHA